MRERSEIDIGQQWSGVIRLPTRVGVDRRKFPSRRLGLCDNLQRRDARRLRVGLVDGHRPCAVRLAVGRQARRPMDRPHLRSRVGGHRGGIEGGVLDVVAHSLDVVRTHRFHVEQGAAVVEVEFAVPAVVHGVAEVHELRRRTDVELQALENGDDVIAFVAQGLLHPPGVKRAGAGPLLYRDLQHFLAAERLNAPRHSGAVDQLADQQQLGHQNSELLARQRGVTAQRWAHAPKPSPLVAGVLQCRTWLMRTRSRQSNG